MQIISLQEIRWPESRWITKDKLNETVNELINYRIKIRALQEIRWSESRWIKKNIWPTKNWKKQLANQSNAKLDGLINEADLLQVKGSEWLCHT
jgi:hypothetical protein